LLKMKRTSWIGWEAKENSPWMLLTSHQTHSLWILDAWHHHVTLPWLITNQNSTIWFQHLWLVQHMMQHISFCDRLTHKMDKFWGKDGIIA
jgi:hypothetical protein